MKISIVTPTFNEATNLVARERELATQEAPWEWIVVDGGSADNSIELARAAGAQVVRSKIGRGIQLNAGARLATGDVLLFLHADTALPSDALAQVRAALLDQAIVGGNFTLSFDDTSFTGHLLAFVYMAKRRLFGIWYGDSAIFVRAITFRTLGGFAEFPILEDAHFVERLQRAGPTRRLDAVVTSSSRRYRGRVVATIVRWTTIFALYKLGIAPRRLARLYAPHNATAEELQAAQASPVSRGVAEVRPGLERSWRG